MSFTQKGDVSGSFPTMGLNVQVGYLDGREAGSGPENRQDQESPASSGLFPSSEVMDSALMQNDGLMTHGNTGRPHRGGWGVAPPGKFPVSQSEETPRCDGGGAP